MRRNNKKQYLKIMIGLPASGKTTIAEKEVANDPMVVKFSRDDFRFMVKDEPMCDPKIEAQITNWLEYAVGNALSVGLSVIVHNTHLSEKYIKTYDRFRDLYGVEIIYQLVDTPFEVCMERNKNRDRVVPDMVMRKMNKQLEEFKKTPYFKNLMVKPDPIVFNTALPKAITFDLDGTVALMNGRDPFRPETCDEDILNEPVGELVYMYEKMGYKIIFLSGREDKVEPQTRIFLERHFSNIQYELFMRKTKDMRNDAIIKEEIYREKILPFYYAPLAVDDRLRVVRMWARIGVFCICVNQGLLEF
jgi:predicted kinase